MRPPSRLPSLSLLSSLSLPLLAALTALTGCGFTGGKDGKADFSYDSGNGCLFGCDTSKPLMLGTTETLTVSGLPATGGSLESSAPGIAGVTSQTVQYQCNSHTATSATSSPGSADAPCPNGGTKAAYITASVTALQAGHATFDVRKADGSLFDSLDVVVGTPAKLQIIDVSNKTVTSLTVTRGSETDVSVLALDSGGGQLQASSGFTFEVADPTIADLREHDFTLLSPALPVHGDSAGTTSITVSAGSATTSLAVTVQ
jgi:hypothetical protein